MKRAIILAGGRGTRLKPYTTVLPKPLMPIGDYPILEVIIRQLAYYGFKHITLAVNHQADIIKAFFNNGSRWGIHIDYSIEHKPLSTMAPLSLISDLPDNFLVMNGDILTDLNFDEFFKYHIRSKNIFTISSYERSQKLEYGVLQKNDMNQLIGFKEKPIEKIEVSMGIYMINKKVLNYIPNDKTYGFDDLMLDLIKDNCFAAIKRYDGYWLDIGKQDDYLQAVEEFDKLKERFLK